MPRLPEIPTIPLDGVAHGVIRLDEAARSRSRDELAAALRERLPELARELLGHPTIQSSREWRWGRHGSLSLVMAGAKAGQCTPSSSSPKTAASGIWQAAPRPAISA